MPKGDPPDGFKKIKHSNLENQIKTQIHSHLVHRILEWFGL